MSFSVMTHRKQKFLTRLVWPVCLILLFLLHPPAAYANNLTISNVRLLNQSDTGDTIVIEFDISWSNSWNDSTNHDGAWVFFKFKNTNTSPATFGHIELKTAGTNPSGFSQGSLGGSQYSSIDLVVPDDKKGVLIIPNQFGSGSINQTDVQVVWDYAHESALGDSTISDGSTYADAIGIEMVYIPEGGFFVGDGTDGSAASSAAFEYGRDSSLPIPINSENGLSFTDDTAGAPYYNSSGGSLEFTDGYTFNVSSSYPKGFRAFYLMKYEITEGQYVAFLNHLTRTAQNTRTAADVSTDTITNYYVMTNKSTMTNRNSIQAPSSGNGTLSPITFLTDRSDRATGYLGLGDMLAYLDWAALRPMTELEYEKAARGPVYPVNNEAAWGTTLLVQATSVSGGLGGEDGTETVLPATAHVNYNNITFTCTGTCDTQTGPLRAGIFAKSTSTNREETGAGYYGNMELSGNILEVIVTIGNSHGLKFTGSHGDGTLTTASGFTGNATNSDWPGFDEANTSRGCRYASGMGARGGDWKSNAAPQELSTSNRSNASATVTSRLSYGGGRGARTAPF